MKKYSFILGGLLSLGSLDTLKAETYYESTLRLSGFYGNKGGSFGEMDFLLPLFQTPYQLGYLDLRAQNRESALWQSSLGAGYRVLSPDMKAMYGLYVFYNAQNSSFNNTYEQLITGVEFKTEQLSFGANYYTSVGVTQYEEASANTYSWQLISGINNNLLLNNAVEDNKIQGTDAELGTTLGENLHVYGGYYYFEATDFLPAFQGPRFRLSYDLSENLSLQGSWQQDSLNGTLWTAGIRISMPIEDVGPKKGLQKSMTDYAQFSLITSPVIGYKNSTPYQVNGESLTFARVNSLSDLNEAISGDSNVIVINQDITLDATKNLPDNIVMTGQSFTLNNGSTVNLTGNNELSEITGAASQDMFAIGRNNHIQDIKMTAVSSPGSNDDLPGALVNNGKSVGDLQIYGLESNGGINMQVLTAGSNNFIVENNQVSNIMLGVSSIEGTGSFTLNNNTITVSDGVGIYIASVRQTNTTIDSINGNTIIFTDNTDGVIGIWVENQGGTQTIKTITNNTVNMGNSNNSQGIEIENGFVQSETLSYSGPQTIGTINNNTVTFADGNGNTGIYLNNLAGHQWLTNTLADNTVTFHNTAASTNANSNSGITFKNNSKPSTQPLKNRQTIERIENNTITLNEAGNTQNSVGISAINHDEQTLNQLMGNTVYYSSALGQEAPPAYLISLSATTQNGSEGKLNVKNFYNNNYAMIGTGGNVSIQLVSDDTAIANQILITIGKDTLTPSGTAALTEANNNISINVAGDSSNITIND
jgi:hypothetical protein